MCWLYAVLFELLVLLKIVGFLVVTMGIALGTIFGIGWLFSAGQRNGIPGVRLASKIGKWLAIALISLFFLSIAAALTVEAKEQVCTKGFGPYWHEFWDTTTKETK